MIPYRHRFHGYNSLRYASKHGVSFRSQYLTLKVSKNPRRSQVRLAVVVSKKVSKSAVSRNRIRRRLYEVLRLTLPRLGSHRDIVLYVGGSAVKDMPYNELEATIHQLMHQAGILGVEDDKGGIISDKKVGL